MAEIFYSITLSNRGLDSRSSTYLFYTDGTYMCDWWPNENKPNLWKVENGVLYWRSQLDLIISHKEKWYQFNNQEDLAQKLETELATWKWLNKA